MNVLTSSFLYILNISIVGTITAIIIIIIKQLFRNRLTSTWHYYIWLILVARLIIPIFPESPFSIFNLTGNFYRELNELNEREFINSTSLQEYDVNKSDNKTEISNRYLSESEITSSNSGIKGSNTSSSVFSDNNNTFSDNNEHSANTHSSSASSQITDSASTFISDLVHNTNISSIIGIISIIWFLGAVTFITYICICNLYISSEMKKCPSYDTYSNSYNEDKNKANSKLLRTFNECKDYLSINSIITPVICDKFGSPCIYGFIKPKLLISETLADNFSEKSIRYIFLHELMHLKRKDILLNIIVAVLKALYWFNPLFWYCFSRMHKDCEVSCDEAVMLKLKEGECIEYGKTIYEVSASYTLGKPLNSIIGMANKKSDTEKRILKAVNFKKPSFLIISLTVVVALVLGAITLTDGVDETRSIDENTVNGTDNSADTSMNTTASPLNSNTEMSNAFEKLYHSILEGYSPESTREDLADEYNYIISKDAEAVEFLKEQITQISDNTSNNISGNTSEGSLNNAADALPAVRKKITAEWLISDIFKARSGDKYQYYRKRHSIVVVTRDCVGRTGPGDDYNEWCSIPENTIILVTGSLDTNWWTAKKITPLVLPDSNLQATSTFDNFLKTDCVEFWINRQDFESHLAHQEPLSFNLRHTYDAEEYKWVIQTGKASDKLYDEENKAEIFDSSGLDKSIVGYAINNELIRLKKDRNNNVIRDNEWVLIERYPFNNIDTSSVIGWIQDKYVVELPEDPNDINNANYTGGMQPMQGFILSDTIIYKEPDTNSERINDIYPELKRLKYIPLACIHILDVKEDWLRVSPGINSFAGWVQKEKVFYRVTDEISNKLYHPEPDLNLFVSKLKEEIVNNPSFVVKAEDTSDVFRPTSEQREALAETIEEIKKAEWWSGGIIDYREAAYPFYRLEFDVNSIIADMLTANSSTYNYDNITNNNDKIKYSMLITTENNLLIMMDNYTGYDYGIGRMGDTVRFITPNIEFINKIKELFPTKPNSSPDNIIYLLNASKLRFKGYYSVKDEFTLQVQINKCVRAIKNAMGKEIPVEKIIDDAGSIDIADVTDNIGNENDGNIEDVNDSSSKIYLFEFEFDDGSVRVVTYTDKYIEYNEKYYEPLKKPHDLLADLFAGYF